MRNGWVAVAVAASALACASARKDTAVANAKSAPKNAQTYDTANGKVVCTYETPLGSHIPERRCVYQEDSDAVRRETVDKIIQHQNAQTAKGG